jgi:uridine kinase
MKISKKISEIIIDKFEDANRPVIIAVGGPGGTGKSLFSSKLAKHLKTARVLRLDDYKTERSFREGKGIFGPHPEANQMELLEMHIEEIKGKRVFFKPVYCGGRGTIDKTETYSPLKYNILDGEISMYDRFMRHIDFSVYVDADLSTQLSTRLTRDIERRGYSYEKAMATFWGSNVREFGLYGLSGRENADIVLFCNDDYTLKISGSF